MFVGKHKAFVAVRNQAGEVVTAAPHQFESIVFPFDTILAETARVASAVDANASLWSDNLKETAGALLAFSTAEYQARSAKWTSLGSLVLVVLSLWLGLWLSDWYTRKLHTDELRAQVQHLQHEQAACEQETATLRKRLEAPAQPAPEKIP